MSGKKLTLVPVLRAGLGMVEGVLRLVPSARGGHIGLYRDHATLEPVDYYFKVPSDAAERDFFVLDPMLATGGSAVSGHDSRRLDLRRDLDEIRERSPRIHDSDGIKVQTLRP